MPDSTRPPVDLTGSHSTPDLRPPPFSDFQSRHLLQTRAEIVEEGNALRYQGAEPFVNCNAIWMVVAGFIGLGLLLAAWDRENRQILIVIAFLAPIAAATPFLFVASLTEGERARGPFLIADLGRRVIELPRDHRTLGFDQIVEILLVFGEVEGIEGWDRRLGLWLVLVAPVAGTNRVPILVVNAAGGGQGRAEMLPEILAARLKQLIRRIGSHSRPVRD